MKTGVLLVNLGTPDSPTTPAVRRYLREFLMDGRVIDIPLLARWALVNLIIAPFRAPRSAREYRKLWQPDGSPLLVHGRALQKALQAALGDEYVVGFGMRYQNPCIEEAVKVFKDMAIGNLIVLPLYPQYASASTGSSLQEVMRVVSRWQVIPNMKTIGTFCDHPLFIRAFAELGRKYLRERSFDHVIFSYHGIPERQILKASVQDRCRLDDCCRTYRAENRYCYRAQCFQTTRLLARELGLAEGSYSISFQSRLGRTPWLRPYTDHRIVELAKEGKKSILFFSPAFVADCLETTVEGGEEYRRLFEAHGGLHWQLVESLNASPAWVECVKALATS